ncbi:calcium-binding protein [Pseudoduganella armeniaca]|uniref:Haemolysin-type calcium binding-related domain-containing protein n=1 Tax=Pseudoduganella armeniaca TaxID=2072590 RepID=A0A2R4CDB4_9BURK|nr:calcium-binding protein [Pseudoduganella armeniaca]AVR97458.1 hypothetical protein C9I28_18785 [Pseudoduganella armeniaca]
MPGETSGGQITVQNWYSGRSHQIEQIAFADGSTMSAAQATVLGNVIRATEGNDTLIGRVDTTFIDGLGGNDTITGSVTGNATLRGGAGDDLINYGHRSNNNVEGGDGKDVLAFAGQPSSISIGYVNILDGGKGDDKPVGGVGSEIYRFSRGDGRDVILDDDAFDGGFGVVDKIAFGTGVAQSDLTFSRSRDDLVIALNGVPGETTVDQITVQNWFGGRSYQIEQLYFDDGTMLQAFDVKIIGTST